MVEARTCGWIYLITLITIWTYYTVWMLVTPLIDEDQPIQSYFPNRESGLMITTAGAYFALAYFCTLTGIILLKDNF